MSLIGQFMIGIQLFGLALAASGFQRIGIALTSAPLGVLLARAFPILLKK